MNIIMVGLHSATCPLEIREKLSLTPSGVQRLVSALKAEKGVKGCVVLSTCNRSEVYLSLGEGVHFPLAAFLCHYVGLPLELYKSYFLFYKNKQLLDHLFSVTAGLDSQLRGDDQILTQVHEAATLSRQVGGSCPLLETLFRQAVTSGKSIKTQVPLYAVQRSVAALGVRAANEKRGWVKGEQALVVGNGVMGRLAASLLVDSGWRVTVTLRAYKHTNNLVPTGCDALPYKERYQFLPQCQLVVSATASPHYTLRRGDLLPNQPVPPLLVDLAVPRDIDPEIEGLEGVTCLTVDQLVPKEQQVDPDKIKEIHQIIQKHQQDFYQWLLFRETRVLAGDA